MTTESSVYDVMAAAAEEKRERLWTWELPAELGHGVGEAEDAGADHGGDIVEGGVPPLGVPGPVDGEPLLELLLLRGLGVILRGRLELDISCSFGN